MKWQFIFLLVGLVILVALIISRIKVQIVCFTLERTLPISDGKMKRISIIIVAVCGLLAMAGATDYRIQIAEVNNQIIVITNRVQIMDGYTTLLVHFDGAHAVSNYTAETGQKLTFVSNARLTTSTKQFGTACLTCDTKGDYVTVPATSDWDFGSGDFTIECWVRSDLITSDDGVFSFITDVTNRINLAVYSSSFYAEVYSDGSIFTGTFGDTIIQYAWYHVAVVRNSNTLTWYVGGASKLTNDVSGKSFDLSGTTPFIGQYSAHSLYGEIDEFRVSKGIARWTANFTPLTHPY